MNQKKLLKLVQTLVTLKGEVKCPICLDVMQEIIELDCGHKYCEECYRDHKCTQKQISCPLCKKILKRRSMIYKDTYASALGIFVYNSCKMIRDIYNCEVEQLLQTLINEMDPVSQDNANILKNNDEGQTVTRVIPSTSKTNNKRMEKSDLSNENYGDAFDQLMQAAVTPSAFNRRGTKRVYINKKKVDKKPEMKYNILEFDNYENKTAVLQWLNDTRNLFDRVTQTQNFDEEHLSPPIIDLTSVSQEKMKESDSKSKCGTIKNVHKWRAKSLDIEIKKLKPKETKRYSDGGGSVKVENYDIEDINTEEEEVVKKVEEKVLLDLIEDEYLNKLENELQDCQDNDSRIKTKKNLKISERPTNTSTSTTSAKGWDRITKIKKTIKKSEKVPKKLNITLQSNHNLITKNDKEISKQNPKSIKKDNISIPQSRGNNLDVSTRNLKVVLQKNNFSKFFSEKNLILNKKGELKIILQNIYKLKQNGNMGNEVGSSVINDEIEIKKTSELKLSDSVETKKNEEKTKSYDFNKLEDYITKNLKLIDKNKSLDSSTSSLEKTPNKDVIEVELEKEHTEAIEKESEINLHHNISSHAVREKDNIETKNDSHVFINDDLLFSMPTQKILNSNTSNAKSKEKTVNDNFIKETFDSVNQKSKYSCGNITDKSKVILQDDSNNKSKEKIENEAVVVDTDDIKNGTGEIFVRTSQKSRHNYQEIIDKSNAVLQNNTKSREANENEVIIRDADDDDDDDDDVDKIYALPTQKIKHACKDVTTKSDVFLENSCSETDLLRLFEESLNKCLANVKSIDMDDIEHQLLNLQFLVAKLKSLTKNNEPTKGTLINIINCNVTTQTDVETVNKEVQTEDYRINAEVQTESIHCHKCNTELNIHEGAKVISQNTKIAIHSMLSEPDVSFKPATQNAVLIKSKNNMPNSKQSSQNEMFTATFDNLNFDTQEITRNQGTILRNPQVKPDSNSHNIGTENNGKGFSTGVVANKSLPESVLVCSLDTTNPTCSKKVNRKLPYDIDKSKRFKRIRMPTSDSESEDEVEAKRKCNRFIRDDLTIEIQTNTERIIGQDKEKNSALELQDSDNINYDDYLAQVMRKYDDNNFSANSTKKSQVPSPKEEVIDDIIVKCEKMIEHASKNIQNVKEINNGSGNSSKDSYQTASQSINNNFDVALTADNMFMDEHNLSKLDKDIQDYERGSVKEQNSEISDIIGNTEELEPLPKRPKKDIHRHNPQSASLFDSSENPFHKQPVEDNSNNICKELNDSFDEADLIIVEEQTNLNKINSLQNEKIKIIENIKIKSQDKKEDMKEEEDDLFSDEDIVETTPQKKIDSFAERSVLSQIDNLVNLPIKDNLPTPLSNTENFDYDFVALPPPPDFQDDNQPLNNNVENNFSDHEVTTVNVDITITNFDLNKSSLTPDKLSQFIVNRENTKDMSQIISCTNQYNSKENQVQNNLSLTPDKLSQLNIKPEPRKMTHSTPVTRRDLARETLGISPIPAKKSQQSSIIEIAQTSKYTPLSSVTKYNPQKHTILTSTPRQKSIWNYVKPPSNEKETTLITKTKPCIACTRLTNEQIRSISKLTSKKLATYSSNFDLSVTHMIVAVNEDNCVKDYTIKFVSAVAAGIWVLRFEWIEECLSNNRIIPEEPFEALDISGIPGPKTSRLTREKNPLFKGYKFYCINPIISTTKQEVENIIKMLDGKVLRDIRDLLEVDGNIGLIIGEGHGTEDFEQYERWVELYKTATVDIEWFSKCVGQYKLLSIRPYVWCSEDNLGDLGYPSYLTETVPLSFTETF